MFTRIKRPCFTSACVSVQLHPFVCGLQRHLDSVTQSDLCLFLLPVSLLCVLFFFICRCLREDETRTVFFFFHNRKATSKSPRSSGSHYCQQGCLETEGNRVRDVLLLFKSCFTKLNKDRKSPILRKQHRITIFSNACSAQILLVKLLGF